jgi:hypothetical protein
MTAQHYYHVHLQLLLLLLLHLMIGTWFWVAALPKQVTAYAHEQQTAAQHLP